MSAGPNYWWEAFKARPLGMPIPPNWFGLAGFALLGAFLSPGFWLLGAGLELTYLYALGSSQRFRKVVDAGLEREDPIDRRYQDLLDQLGALPRKRHQQMEARAREILSALGRTPLMAGHAGSVEQLVWLHLRLLSASQGIARVRETAQRERETLASQEAQIEVRLADAALDADLRRSLEQQKAVIDQRQAAHESAARRAEHVESELQRIDQQLALIREQVLLSTDAEQVGQSLDALTSSYNEASQWLDSQRDLLGALDTLESNRLPSRVLRGESARGTPSQSAQSQGE